MMTCFCYLVLFLVLNQANSFKDNRVTADQLPLYVNGRYVVDKNGKRVKFACMNWYGAEEFDYVVGGMQWQNLSFIASLLPKYGFNCVRLLFSLELIESNPIITNTTTLLKNEPSLWNKHAMDIFDFTVKTITNQNIMVILDNHVSDAGWCCSGTDGNGLWYTNNYPAQSWLNDWKNMANRYKDNPFVVGADLRNELRQSTVKGKTLTPTWGDNNDATDWRKAAIECAKNIQSVNPNLLIVVEIIQYASQGQGVATHPILNGDLSVSNKLLYEAHDYSWYHNDGADYKTLEKSNNERWGYIITP
eukprot:201537_1